GKAEAWRADSSRSPDLDAAIGAAVRELGALEVMVNNAGILDGYFNVDDMDESTWRRVIDIDLTGVFLGSKRGLREMLPRGRGRGTERHRRRRGLHCREARRGRPDAPDGGDLRRARDHGELRLPRRDPDFTARALAEDPRSRRSGHERAGRRRER